VQRHDVFSSSFVRLSSHNAFYPKQIDYREPTSGSNKWLKQQKTIEKMDVEWLALSMFDLQSHFTLSFRQLVVDVNIVRDSLTVTRMEGDSNYRKVQFFSDAEFELYLKMELRRQMKKEQ
jgi:hypothetical protein